MAVSGRRFGGSVKESDFLYDFPCSVCDKDSKNVEAIKFCVDCNENLCATCLTNHNKFPLMRGHNVLDQVQTIQGQTKQLPTQRCSKHGGKIIDVFCPEHDTVGCSTCISVDHSSCKGKTFIPDVAAGFKSSSEVKQLETEMNTLMSKLDSLKKLKGDNLQRLRQDKDDLKKEIRSVRKKMNEQLDKMEKKLMHDADTKFKEKINAIQTTIAEIDDMLAKLKQALGQVKNDTNDADIFISCKNVKREISEKMHPMQNRITDLLPERSLELQAVDTTKLIMEGKMMFASITEKSTIHEVEYEEDINIRDDTDLDLCCVMSMCALPNGCLVMADYGNKKLKKLDPVSNKVSTLINLPDLPVDLCLVDNTRLAVSLRKQKKIQFVSLSGKVTLENSFTVGDGCRGLAHCDGLLYVCCGGSRIPDNKEGCGHVEVYNCNGELLRSFYEELCCPRYINVINDGYNTTLYTAGRYKGVQLRGSDGVVKHRYPTVLNTDLPFCLIGIDQICIGEYDTGIIYIQTRNDKRILIENKGLKNKPRCLYFDKRSSQLFVVVDVNDDEDEVIQVFKLKM